MSSVAEKQDPRKSSLLRRASEFGDVRERMNYLLMNKLIIANWKMNPGTVSEAQTLARATDEEGVVLCPPSPYLEAVRKTVTHAQVGAQNTFWESRGAYTGEVSSTMIARLGCWHTIIGHSERRRYMGETDGMINKKTHAALKADLTPILCIGESKEEHENGKKEEIITRQVKTALGGIPTTINTKPISLIVTYEPIWAISTNEGAKADNPQDIVEMIELIRSLLKALGYMDYAITIYGGSVTADNAQSFLQHEEIQGALVGGASLREEEFKKIINIAKQL
jgi:triosephosphate isomerase (TIM)